MSAKYNEPHKVSLLATEFKNDEVPSPGLSPGIYPPLQPQIIRNILRIEHNRKNKSKQKR